MAKSVTSNDKKHTASADGVSDHIELLPGKEYKISFTSAGAFALDLQEMLGDG